MDAWIKVNLNNKNDMGKIHEYYALIDKLEAMFQGKLTEKQGKLLEEL